MFTRILIALAALAAVQLAAQPAPVLAQAPGASEPTEEISVSSGDDGAIEMRINAIFD